MSTERRVRGAEESDERTLLFDVVESRMDNEVKPQVCAVAFGHAERAQVERIVLRAEVPGL